MLSNLHTHTSFCDGKNTPEEMVLSAIEKGFCSLGFSGHSHTLFDTSYCMTDTKGYIAEIARIKENYKNDIEIYSGVEEDSAVLVAREDFDYIIGSSHYVLIDGKYHPVDSTYEELKECLALCGNDPLSLAHAYFKPFCDYIKRRKPDIVGHFDLITKFDEKYEPIFLGNKDYDTLAEGYMLEAVKSGCLFEVNTGAVARGLRTNPYPQNNLLQILRKNGNGIVISSDSHSADTLDFGFDETRRYLKDQGFEYVWVLYKGEFTKDYL